MDKDTQIESLKESNKALKEQVEKLKKVFRATHKTKYELIKKLEETSGCH